MSTYRNTITGEVRDLDPALITAWQEAGNPKASMWVPYTPPAPAAPAMVSDFEVTRKQLLVGLAIRHGIRYADIQAQLAALYPDAASIERYVAECHLEDSLAFQRGHPLLTAISAQFGLSSDQIDDLFRYASTVR